MTKIQYLILVVVVVGVGLVMWGFTRGLAGNGASIFNKNKTVQSVDDEPILDAEYLTYISQVKKQLSDDKIKNIDDFIARVIESNRTDPMTKMQLWQLEVDLVNAEMKTQIKDRYDQEIPRPSKNITTGDTYEDFGMAVVTYYGENAKLTSDGGEAVRDAIKKAMDDGTIDLLDLSNVQDAYSEKQQATTKKIGSKAAGDWVYKKLLAYYQETEQMRENESTLELKKLIKQAGSNDSVSLEEFNQIETLHLKIHEANVPQQ